MIELKVMYGVKELKIKKPFLMSGTETRGWWIFKRDIKVWSIHFEYCILGPYYNEDDAQEMFALALAAYR